MIRSLLSVGGGWGERLLLGRRPSGHVLEHLPGGGDIMATGRTIRRFRVNVCNGSMLLANCGTSLVASATRIELGAEAPLRNLACCRTRAAYMQLCLVVTQFFPEVQWMSNEAGMCA